MGLDCRPKLGRNEAMICRLGMSYNPCHEQDNQNVDRFGDGSVFRLCDLFFDGSRSIPLRGLHGVSRTNGLCHGCGDHPPGGTTHGWRHSLRQDLVRRHRQRRLLAKFAQKCHVQVVAPSRQRILAKRRSIPTTVSSTGSGAFQREVRGNSIYVGSGLY